MMKLMIDSVPFVEDIISDTDEFRDTILSAVQMYQDENRPSHDMQRTNSMFGDSSMPVLDAMNGMTNENDNLASDELSKGDDCDY